MVILAFPPRRRYTARRQMNELSRGASAPCGFFRVFVQNLHHILEPRILARPRRLIPGFAKTALVEGFERKFRTAVLKKR